MTDWKHHLAYGFGIEVVVALCLFISQYEQLTIILIIECIIIMLISPLIMDMDHRNSKLREVFIGTGLIGVSVGYYTKLQKLLLYSIIFSLVSFTICYLTKHRGILHSLPFVVGYAGIIYIITKNINLAIIGGIGSYTHLIFDKEYIKMW